MNFQQYLNDIPLLHTWDNGKTWKAGGFAKEHLSVFHRLAGGDIGGKTILETGAGNSTLTFLFAKPAKVVSIAPSADLFARIRAHSAKLGLDATPLKEIVDRSETALPQLAKAEHDAGRKYDVALLDGGHGWPTVFVDFCYANMLLRKGGIVWVDDVQLHAVKELARQLEKQPEFRLVEDLGKVLAFEKLTDEPFLADFGTQPYIVEKTAGYAQTPNPFAR